MFKHPLKQSGMKNYMKICTKYVKIILFWGILGPLKLQIKNREKIQKSGYTNSDFNLYFELVFEILDTKIP